MQAPAPWEPPGPVSYHFREKPGKESTREWGSGEQKTVPNVTFRINFTRARFYGVETKALYSFIPAGTWLMFESLEFQR